MEADPPASWERRKLMKETPEVPIWKWEENKVGNDEWRARGIGLKDPRRGRLILERRRILNQPGSTAAPRIQFKLT